MHSRVAGKLADGGGAGVRGSPRAASLDEPVVVAVGILQHGGDAGALALGVVRAVFCVVVLARMLRKFLL
jgi:hypothetical protein